MWLSTSLVEFLLGDHVPEECLMAGLDFSNINIRNPSRNEHPTEISNPKRFLPKATFEFLLACFHWYVKFSMCKTESICFFSKHFSRAYDMQLLCQAPREDTP